ncbi:MAG: hypothetical protein M3331_00170 [Actinomycetota bacterium]|nr:hypothetical protein [Actinomycetota bacterium]
MDRKARMTMVRLSLPDKVLALDRALSGARIPHAFGGALALAYYAEPRTTIDVDVNVFISPRRHEEVAAALAPLGVRPNPDPAALLRDGQARWLWEETPVDLFFSNDPIHDAMQAAIKTVPFGEELIPILAPEHLLVCKAAFDRPKDWLDIEQMVAASPSLNRREVWKWLDRIAGPQDARRARLEKLLPSDE